MNYHYNSTQKFFSNIKEIHSILLLTDIDPNVQQVILKSSIILLIAKFQVFIESILDDFRNNLNGIKSSQLPLHMKLNSVRISILNENPLIGYKAHFKTDKGTYNKLCSYLKSHSYLHDEQAVIDSTNLIFDSKFPLGKTGKKELQNLFSQINGEKNIFEKFYYEEFNFDKLDSILQVRHTVVHRDIFNGTKQDILTNIKFLGKLVRYIDSYLNDNLSKIIKEIV